MVNKCDDCGERHPEKKCPEKRTISKSAPALGLDTPVTIEIEEKWLQKALDHLFDAQHPEVQFTEDMESMYSEAKVKAFVSIQDAIECLKAGSKIYWANKEG